MPPEICKEIFSWLPNRDIKNLRLASSFFESTSRLRIDRVFVSANPRNVDVARAIAGHETYRKRVVEIIWDDARLARPKPQRTYLDRDISWSDDDGCPYWFARACRENVNRLEQRMDGDADRPEIVAQRHQLQHLMSLPDAWLEFVNLRNQQDAIIRAGADEEAFRHVLARCPAVKTVSITPAAHGLLFTPLYETPMIRSFPVGFQHAIPRGWPTNWDAQPPYIEAPPWGDASEKVKNKWRGFRIVTRILAQEQHHNVSELLVDVHGVTTGLNCHIFDYPCEELTNFMAVLERPGFRRLELSLLIGGLRKYDWFSYRSGRLREALSKAVDMEHVRLHTDVDEAPGIPHAAPEGWVAMHDFVPLGDIFPIDKWPRLKYFGLSRFGVTQADLLSLLAALPETVRTIELSHLDFLDNSNYRDLLIEIRDTLGWKDRAPEDRPRVSLTADVLLPQLGRTVWLDNEVHSFLYEDGENPFPDASNMVRIGRGIQTDEFDPSFQRPYVDNMELARLGFTELCDHEIKLLASGTTIAEIWQREPREDLTERFRQLNRQSKERSRRILERRRARRQQREEEAARNAN